MKIVIAPDSCKGCATAMEADGGEWTMENLVAVTKGYTKEVLVIGPLRRPIEAKYGVLGDNKTCIIDMATASGLNLISRTELDPLNATTYGTGQLIRHALDEGFRSFVLELGGSATNDGGAGMLQALGLELRDNMGAELDFGGGLLDQLHTISAEKFDPRIGDCQFLLASDVENPFVGPNGASHVFGPQKGATKEMVELLDNNLYHFADLIEKEIGVRLHELPGAGAAGGIGGAFLAFFPSTMRRGEDVVLEYAGLNANLSHADLVFNGEGQLNF